MIAVKCKHTKTNSSGWDETKLVIQMKIILSLKATWGFIKKQFIWVGLLCGNWYMKLWIRLEADLPQLSRNRWTWSRFLPQTDHGDDSARYGQMSVSCSVYSPLSCSFTFHPRTQTMQAEQLFKPEKQINAHFYTHISLWIILPYKTTQISRWLMWVAAHRRCVVLIGSALCQCFFFFKADAHVR